MPEQLQISFGPFPLGLFKEVKKHYAESEQEKLFKELNHLKNSVRAYKGHKTKRSKKQ